MSHFLTKDDKLIGSKLIKVFGKESEENVRFQIKT